MIDQPNNLILASQSPRRRMLLTHAGYRFSVDSPDDDVEQSFTRQVQGVGDKSCDTGAFVGELALAKARNVAGRHESAVVLGADTVAECDGSILGKPVDRNDALQMLRTLSGREHLVFTGVCLWHRPSDLHLVHVEQTRLRMDMLTDAQLDLYLSSNAWVGKAGAFGYQDGWDWLHVIEGSESNVVGLPVDRLPELLNRLWKRIPE